jgi:hypothetical protein
MMNSQKQITTNAPSIRYEGDLRPEQAGIMQKQAQAMQQMQQQAMMQQQQTMMQQQQMGQPQMAQAPIGMAMGGALMGPTVQTPQGIQGLNMPGYENGGRMPAGRMPAAYGGVMGMDGRKNYGIGSWFQKAKDKFVDDIIPNEIKENPLTSAAIAALAANQFDLSPDIIFGEGSTTENYLGKLLGKITPGDTEFDTVVGNKDAQGKNIPFRTPGVDPFTLSKLKELNPIREDDEGNKSLFGLSPGMLATVGGGVAGLFSDKLNPPDAEGNIDYGAGIGIQNVAKAANILDPKQAMAAGIRFSPELSARKYSPAEMLESYGSANEPLATANLAGGGISQLGIPDYEQQMMNPDMMEQIRMLVEGMQAQGMNKESMEDAVRMQVPDMSADMSMGYAEGGSSGEMGTVMEEGEEMLDMNGMEKDYREDGGFVPIGEYEKKDDVPARLSVNEFVFTADAVRGAGDGDVDKGAERLQGIMKQLEQQGRPEGMEMLDVSERLSEVV